jgi:hypothetical protein
MGRILENRRAPRGLTLATTCPPLPEGGASAIAGWLTRNPAARMIVIDVFAKVRGRAAAAVSAYDADYAAIGHAKKLADDYGVAVVLVHHVRKAGAEDFLEAVSGTNGLAGAADATLVLRRPRGEADGMLSVTGRDVDESEYALRFTAENGSWALLDGPPGDYALSGTRAAIVRHVRTHPDSAPKAIPEATGINHANVRKTCLRMAEDGQLVANAAGRYRAAGTSETPTPESVTEVTTVTEPMSTCENSHDFEGHPEGPGCHRCHRTPDRTGRHPGGPAPMTAITEHAPLLYKVPEVLEMLRMSRTQFYAQVNAGRLRIVNRADLRASRPTTWRIMYDFSKRKQRPTDERETRQRRGIYLPIQGRLCRSRLGDHPGRTAKAQVRLRKDARRNSH